MASSNRHWPSMFKSKPCNPTHHQWPHHDLSSSLLSSNSCHRTPYSSTVGSCEERTPEPKPRWNPRPEQIRILESIFNSGMVNPPRDEIRKIRAQLQEYGQVGDANVFYWFQNRKSRSKHKQRQLHNTTKSTQLPQTTTAPPPMTVAAATTAPSSSSSSSDKSSPNSSVEKTLSVATSATVIDLLNSPTASVNQPFFHASTEFLTEPSFFFPVQQNTCGTTTPPLTQGFCFPDVPSATASADQSTMGNCPSFLLSELMLMNHGLAKKSEEDDEKIKFQQQVLGFNTATAASHSILPPSLSIPTPTHNILQGVAEVQCAARSSSTVYINDLCFEVGVGPLNVREAFGDDVVLIQSTGEPVLMNEWGVTLLPLQHGACYYLVPASTVVLSPHHHDKIKTK